MKAGNLCTKLCDVPCCSTFLTDLLTKNCKDNAKDFVSRTRTRTRIQVTRIRTRTSPSRTCCWSLRSPQGQGPGQGLTSLLFSALSPSCRPQNTWPWMTLNGLNGPTFKPFNFHYYDPPLFLIHCYECVSFLNIHVDSACDQLWSTASGEEDRDPPNI